MPLRLLWYLCFTASVTLNWKQVLAHTFCPVSYQLIGPVCGTDGITYPSICDLENARLSALSLDVALLKPCNNYCTETWDPICGSDMVTYSNTCMFANAVKVNMNLKVFHTGQCLTPLAENTNGFRNYKVDRKIKNKRRLRHFKETAKFS